MIKNSPQRHGENEEEAVNAESKTMNERQALDSSSFIISVSWFLLCVSVVNPV
jgi:hypothetical protein